MHTDIKTNREFGFVIIIVNILSCAGFKSTLKLCMCVCDAWIMSLEYIY